jgi:hypothetical protein
MRTLICVVCTAAIVAGCGAAGHGSVGPLPRPQPSSTAHSGGNAVFVIKIPKAKSQKSGRMHFAGQRSVRTQYVSQSTQSISIAANGGVPFIADLTPNSPGCVPPTQNTPLTCTISAPEPVGADTFSFTTYDQTGATGNALSSATVTATIVAGQANDVSVTLNGIVASISLSLVPANPPLGTPAEVGLTVDAMDADGNIITSPGSYVDASGNAVTITLSDSDSKHTTLSQATVASPSASVTVDYDGGALTSALFTATTGEISTTGSQDAVLAPSSGSAAPVPVPTTLSVNGNTDSRTFSVSEPSYSGTFTATPSDTGICTVNTVDGTDFTVMGGSSAGICTVTVTDSNGIAAQVYVSNTVTNVSVD